ncbi:MAG TPA: hypothetical protein VFN61_08490 [Acidimicrobiales bacterium]|nr:hypothetical protein [Acidimicrobiales bacterium]
MIPAALDRRVPWATALGASSGWTECRRAAMLSMNFSISSPRQIDPSIASQEGAEVLQDGLARGPTTVPSAFDHSSYQKRGIANRRL